MSTPVLHVLVGSNGAGKSTLWSLLLGPCVHLRFINADEMFRDDPDAYADEYAAGRAAAAARDAAVRRRESFATETVFSHPTKLDLLDAAAAAGYLVHLHVVMVPVALTVRRVAERVARGGHDVAEDKVRSRYELLWANVAAAVPRVSRATFYDNSTRTAALRTVAVFADGAAVGAPAWPQWAPPELLALDDPPAMPGQQR